MLKYSLLIHVAIFSVFRGEKLLESNFSDITYQVADKEEIVDIVAYWVNIVLIFILGSTFLFIWSRVIYKGAAQKNFSLMLRALNSVLLLIIWMALILIQLLIPLSPVYRTTLFIGYFSLGLSLIALWRFVLYQTGSQLKELFKVRMYRSVFITVLLVYSVLYLFATSMVTIVDSENYAQPGIKITDSFGPLTMWPTMEFFVPKLQLFGSLSIGTILVMITITGFTGVGITLLFHSLQRNRKNIRTVGRTTGVSLIIPLASFSCCSLPLFYPLFVLLIGSTAAESITALLMDWTGALFNLIQITILSFLAITVGSIDVISKERVN
ncbi:hypothetical protein [Terrihalobacillus insolitus]|uniref:hypothetical protein n=1 Tax=Terrihalobacillus insolitus TaxID=2950438 RepID=UPI00233FBDE0|nr:hypothetical protein [Terrihalobacillus insolitus]MDC3412945.1 hypothetical protein [Terrihalobacillus insolitus]